MEVFVILIWRKGIKQSHTLENSLILMTLKKPTRKIFWLKLSPFIQNCIQDIKTEKGNIQLPV